LQNENIYPTFIFLSAETVFHMKKAFAIIFCCLLFSSLIAQEKPAAYRAYTEKYPEGPALNRQDSLFLLNIPEKAMPVHLRSGDLPPVVDNSELPYLRPVFLQEGPSCGQAAMIGYNFTYEMDYLRGLTADSLPRQYPTHFTWNFQNGGEGWYGVSYFHSIEILRLCGCMNALEYGNYYDDGKRWINGYDLYYSGMHNRVRGVYSIHTGTEEGILALKHWIYNHMGEGEHGGVASYYANVPWNAQILNDTTPEGGKYVMTAWYPNASHAMTIVGYNDSIRWDYNNDGQYTNDLDINWDGRLDPRDWEFGAVKFVNSHGDGAQNEGFCYMMYKCLAEKFEDGGVWNQAVHILDVDESYQPLMAYKVTLKHNNRQKVKVLAGVSQDTTESSPAWIMDFPIIDYQGSYHYLQGNDTSETLQYLEFGLDITPLLSYLQPGEPAKFFFIVDENDPFYEGEGEITSFSVMDYTSGMLEIISGQTPLPLENNSRTMASVVHLTDFNIVEITTDALPPFTVNEPYSFQLEAEGGSVPYAWSPQYNYRVEQSSGVFPMVEANQVLISPASDTIVPVGLGFDFPFYGKIYDTVYMHIDGHLQFENTQLPWPYMQELDLQFRSNRMITPLTTNFFTIIPGDGDGGWYEADDTSAVFRWKLSWEEDAAGTDINFAVKLCQNGNILFYYGASTLQDIYWIGGVSAGNKSDYIYSPVSGSFQIPQGHTVSLIYHPFPVQLAFSPEGILTGTLTTDGIIYDLSFRVTDRSGISSAKTLQLSTGPKLFFTVHANGDDRIDYGDTVRLDLEIYNDGPDELSETSLELISDDPYVNIPDDNCMAGTILPGEQLLIPDAFTFVVSLDVPDKNNLLFYVNLSSAGQAWYKELNFVANAPQLKIRQVTIADNDNNRLDPGETAPMMVTIQNTGHASIYGVNAELVSLDQEVQVLENPVQIFGMIGKGESVTRPYVLYADDSTPDGFRARFILSVESLPGLQRQDTIVIKIGKTPVLVVDMDPNHHSGPGILAQLEELNVLADYEYSLPSKLEDYMAIFVSLGYHFSNHVLTWSEGEKLAGFLDSGGRIYMEGKKTWKDDPQTPVHLKFNLVSAGTPTTFDTITGIDGTFSQGIKLLNETVHPFSFYYIEPVEPAYIILQDQVNLKPCAVAFDAGVYKTIGTLFDFGTLIGLPPSASGNLIRKYLEFFDIYVEPIRIDEDGVEYDQWQLWLYPDPAVEQITVASRKPEAGGRKSSSSIMIIDLFGRQIKELNNISSLPYLIDISDLQPGMYILRMVSADGASASAKFLKVSE
jgi:hypothetical protein